ncbi:MAG: aspartate carbamoyltransferase [Clostridia bacterium]|nr:aspartate carbamoyltransferase [Clostridia bacterium]
MRSVIDVVDLSVKELNDLIKTAMDIIKRPKKYANAMKGKKLATLFFEPSTRTRLSFESAMLELGGQVIGVSDASSSSSAKGESIADTAKVVSCYADVIAMRSPTEGAAYVASKNAEVPVINAGDGGHCHPTQTLADLLTIYRKKGTFDNLTIGFCGDLKYGRTVHSLLNAMARYSNVKVVLISPKELKIPDYVKSETLLKANMEYVETEDLESAIPSLDVLYMTRIQQERFDDKDEYERLKNSYVLTVEKLQNAKEDMCIMHPLPRVNEISVNVDEDSRACYFEQVKNGKFMRMALILMLVKDAKANKQKEERALKGLRVDKTHRCANPKCAFNVERELESLVFEDEKEGVLRCAYCEKEVK